MHKKEHKKTETNYFTEENSECVNLFVTFYVFYASLYQNVTRTAAGRVLPGRRNMQEAGIF